MAAAPAGGEAVEWIDEPLGKGVRARGLRRLRTGCLLLAGLLFLLMPVVTAVRLPEILIWVLLGLGAVLLGLALRLLPLELPERLGLRNDGIVVVVSGKVVRQVRYAQIVGMAKAEGATATARLRFRTGPAASDGIRELLLDREVAERVLAKASTG